jgi:uncharacterized protein YpmB
MSRKRKQKRQRFILIISLMFIVLLIVIIKSMIGNPKQDLNTSQTSQENINEQTDKPQSTNDNGISEIKVSPNICTANRRVK